MTPAFTSRRSPVYARRGMVASSQPLASQAGLSVLASGGSAADAAVAGLASGEKGADIHTAMIAMSQANLEMRIVTAVRDKGVEAINDLLRTPL